MKQAPSISLAQDPELEDLLGGILEDFPILPIPPGTAPPRGERLWVAGIAAWAAAGEDWIPSGLLPLAREPGRGPWLTAPEEIPRGGFRSAPLAAPHAWSTAALAAFQAFGRGGLAVLEDEKDRIEALREGRAAGAVVLEGSSIPGGWWRLDLASWWKETSLTPLVLGFLWRRPGADLPEGLPQALPAHREGARQLLEGAAELGLAGADLEEAFSPRAWRRS